MACNFGVLWKRDLFAPSSYKSSMNTLLITLFLIKYLEKIKLEEFDVMIRVKYLLMI